MRGRSIVSGAGSCDRDSELGKDVEGQDRSSPTWMRTRDPGARLRASGQSYVWRGAASQGHGLSLRGRHRAPRDSAVRGWKELVSRGGAGASVCGRGLDGAWLLTLTGPAHQKRARRWLCLGVGELVDRVCTSKLERSLRN